jgi:YVTN family beta-propeller protein
VNYESQHVHPLALSADGTQLFAVNTPDNRLAVFDITDSGLSLAFEIPVGLDPVSVAVESDTRVWVANWMSDTVSIVDLTTRNVVTTLHVGDEPTDIVFAGSNRERAFVCVSQEDAVRVYDTTDLAAPPVAVPIFGSDPQALAVSPDGLSVYVAVFESGNRTTIAGEQDVVAHGGLPEPNPAGRPNTGLILEWDGTEWVDEDGTVYTDTHPYTLPDHDVAVLDATAATPVPSYIDGMDSSTGLGRHRCARVTAHNRQEGAHP